MMNSIDKNNLLAILPNDDVLSQCMHCGMCLATCPTYELTMQEKSSPRGRIRLIKSVARGELEITPAFVKEMSYCLDCQACETACPAGVKYGSMVEASRVMISNGKSGRTVGNYVKKFGMNFIVAEKIFLKITANILKFYQRSGMQKLIHKSKVMNLFSKNLSEIDKLSPRISDVFSDKIIKEINMPYGEVKHNVLFLTGCIMNVAFSEINQDTLEVLLQNNCRVICPKEQGCCGSLHAHYGELPKAVELAKHNLEIFSKYDFDFLVSNSAGCGAFMKEYVHLFENDPKLAEKAKIFSSKILDITEFITSIELNKNIGTIDVPVTYHDACHLCHTQKITKAPRDFLKLIPGLSIIPLEESMWCCGSAGIYNVVEYEDSMKILERKMKNISSTKAKIVVTGNPGCIGQIKYGAEKFNVDIEVIHPATLMNRAYKNYKSS